MWIALNLTKSSTNTVPKLVLTWCWPLATRLRHSWSNLASAPSARTRASAGVAGPLAGFIALWALNPFGNRPSSRSGRRTVWPAGAGGRGASGSTASRTPRWTPLTSHAALAPRPGSATISLARGASSKSPLISPRPRQAQGRGSIVRKHVIEISHETSSAHTATDLNVPANVLRFSRGGS